MKCKDLNCCGEELGIGCSDNTGKFFVFCADCDLEGIEQNTPELAINSYKKELFSSIKHDRMSFYVERQPINE